MNKKFETDEELNSYWENRHDVSVMPDIVEKNSIFVYRTADDPPPSCMHFYECMACDDVQSAAALIQHTVLKEIAEEAYYLTSDSEKKLTEDEASEMLAAFCAKTAAELNACRDIFALSDVCVRLSRKLPGVCNSAHYVCVITNGIRGVLSLAASEYPIYANDFVETMAGFRYAFMNADKYDAETEYWVKKAFLSLQFGN